MFLTSFVVLSIAIGVLVLGSKIKILHKVMEKVKNKLMFSSVFRS